MVTLNKNRVVVAMSGGVDSSVAALLLKRRGYEVVGVSMKLSPSPWPSPQREREEDKGEGVRSCCSSKDVEAAEGVCKHIGIPFHRINLQGLFQKKVIDYFAGEYCRGRTPNPCVACNEHIKFDRLLKIAFDMGAYYLATGHYIKRRKAGGRFNLYKAGDDNKDQSYFLYMLNQDQLKHILFPIGYYKKPEVRAIARKFKLPTAERPESQEVCFVPDGGHASFIEQYYQDIAPPPGAFVDLEGNVVGRHAGIHTYTIGQRRGLGVSGKQRLYVTGINREDNTIVIGGEAGVKRPGLVASSINWVSGTVCTSEVKKVEVKIRYRQRPLPARLRTNCTSEVQTVQVEFEKPDGAVCPGQAVVFYKGKRLLGGGVIEGPLTIDH